MITSWPWIFYINAPVGHAAAWLTWCLMRTRESVTRKLPIDSVGLALFVVGVGALQVMLDKGKELDWFASGEIVALAVAAVVALSFFVVWELTERHPVVDLTLFKRRNFATGVVAVSLLRAVLRHRRRDAFVAAAVYGLHGDLAKHTCCRRSSSSGQRASSSSR